MCLMCALFKQYFDILQRTRYTDEICQNKLVGVRVIQRALLKFMEVNMKKKMKIGGDPDDLDLELTYVRVVKTRRERWSEIGINATVIVAATTVAQVIIIPALS